MNAAEFMQDSRTVRGIARYRHSELAKGFFLILKEKTREGAGF